MSSAALDVVTRRHRDMQAMLELRLELSPAESRRIKGAMRGAARVAEIEAMRWLLNEHGVATCSTRQLDDPEFNVLPHVRDVAALHGIALPEFVILTDEEIDAVDDERFDEDDERFVVLDVDVEVADVETELL